jgi:hypothetical protein
MKCVSAGLRLRAFVPTVVVTRTSMERPIAFIIASITEQKSLI